MKTETLKLWFSVVSIIGMMWGVAFSFFGLAVIPVVDPAVLVPWGNGVYGATLIGLSATLFLVGRHAFEKHDTELMKALLYSILIWLIIEAAFSLYYGVFLNVGVDVGIAVLFGVPLLKGMRSI